MTIDILFLAKNRLEFTRQALGALIDNTNWSKVRALWLWDDGSADGTLEELRHIEQAVVPVLAALVHRTRLGSPAAVMNEYVRHPERADVFTKIDADTIVPPGWLDTCAAVMEAHPELDLLGIEPPASRVPSRPDMPQKLHPELETEQKYRMGLSPTEVLRHAWRGYAPCESIGGIGLMRTRAFLEREPLRPYATYGGFTDWQIAHKDVVKGWCVPPLKCFLLDRLPMEPWASLSREYEAKSWQRPWGRYPMSAKDDLWGWWVPVPMETTA